MAKDFAEQLSRIGDKAKLITMRYSVLKEENARLREQLIELQATLIARDAEIEQQRLELEHMRVSSAIAPDSSSAREARATIAELVREIDACVADLMKDI